MFAGRFPEAILSNLPSNAQPLEVQFSKTKICNIPLGDFFKLELYELVNLPLFLAPFFIAPHDMTKAPSFLDLPAKPTIPSLFQQQ